ncbi:MAG: zinc-binding dehydrogenase [Nitrososphaerota archaeon]|nr:zinc-binding dehydrogenase [Nitrososphaerota archaeon]MDG6982882.1 zinc-binding dehydrogenase [Nitrososphaerota archaeon]
MKAVRFHRHGGPEVLVHEEAPDPVPSADEALVRVKACALNHLDLWARNGLPNVEIPLPHISGSDISGTVEWVPKEEKYFAKGDEVIVNPGVGCGRCDKCLAGKDDQCRDYTIIGYGPDGGYAELVKVRRDHLIRKPEKMTFEEAASFPLVFETAHHMLTTKARVAPGETVLVLAASSGVGSAAIQIAKLFGARVIATAGGQEKMAKAKALGADEVIDHYKDDVLAEVRRLTEKRGVDVVVEHVGKATWSGSLKSLARGGRLVTCGATTGPEVSTDLRYVYNRELTIYGSFMAGMSELLEVVKLFREGRLKTVVDSVYPLAKAAEAQSKMEASGHFGKIVLAV